MSGYTKLFGSILASTVWELPVPTKVVWITMLAMADRHGEVQASVPGLAKLAGVSIPECEAALQCFLSPDPYSRTKDDNGRRIREIDGGWHLINHRKYTQLLSDEDRRERDAERQRRHRLSRSVTSDHASHDTQTKTHTQTDPPIVPQRGTAYSADFVQFWELYPRKVGKGAAWRSWKRQGAVLEPIRAALAWQTKTSEWRKDGGAFVPHPATSLNGRRWEDEPKKPPAALPPVPSAPLPQPPTPWTDEQKREAAELTRRLTEGKATS